MVEAEYALWGLGKFLLDVVWHDGALQALVCVQGAAGAPPGEAAVAMPLMRSCM
jgi:hypothetical protein